VRGGDAWIDAFLGRIAVQKPEGSVLDSANERTSMLTPKISMICSGSTESYDVRSSMGPKTTILSRFRRWITASAVFAAA